MAAQDDAAHLHADGSEGQTASRFGFLDADENLPQYHIEAQASLVDRPLRALKYGEAFAVLDSYGDIGWVPGPEGLYFQDTRYLSRLALTIEDERPMMLSSAIQDDNGALSVDLTTPDIRLDAGDETAIPRELIAIERTKFLFKGACYDRIGLRNYDTRRRRLRIGVTFDADYRDLFEVRGSDRANRGKRTVERRSATEVQFRYAGLDEMVRTTSLHFGPKPHTLEPGKAEFVVELEPGANTSLFIRVVCQSHRAYTSAPGPERAGESAAAALSRAAGSLAEQPDRSLGEGRVFARAYRDNRRDQRQITAGITTIISSNDQFNEGLCRATADLYMLATRTQEGIYPFAGIPWYSTVFGRDGIITAMMALWIDPNFGKGVLRFLAATQAKEVDPAADAQPGKVLHETRRGEMAMLGEVPFRHYYGTIDGTPLFVMLAAQYHEVTGDLDTIRAIWPQLKLALEWIDTYGDRDGDGFVEYARETEQGLANQGWKDSHDSIFHADGAMAKGPIALCEVQGYVYAAKRGAARLASMLGEDDLSVRLSAAANTLRENFDKAFWCEEIGTYALALDGAKRQCAVRSSNTGHALFTDIALPKRAAGVAAQLLSNDGFNGWGIRTIAKGEARYNPMSYHNGSIWPHDNAICALGLARYGLKEEAALVFEGMFDTSLYYDQKRLPELFCGFMRRRQRGPVSYPVACSPQAWAAAAPFAFLAACLGLEIDQARNRIRFRNPILPRFLDAVELFNLKLGDSRADIRLHRHGNDVTVSVTRRVGDVQIAMLK
ncbi:MAG: glycogen debranching N-terminal domain-containing protein [Methylobacteriaceae bacterium]|jgi:glycogen debranching enzyme|uniref:Amylo-alpha-1,6-glucosidase n=1 Tax=Methylorubrum extorquens TaxID=408 RepID=A0AAX3WLM8_METEX|nr:MULTISPECIES: glycogen debranching N-terminal domain-containing protein [Methylobacteriaceae]KQO85230.1 amylo-alpha-1,6-glucosidase [Methylobacterium sp. Leaf90]KQQ24545.1 amylo-alpha-1,6-glucosidase [Methylobacterium sp. Leaf122]MCY1641367.1 amylo-alpha-1,6-glucosidase [Methylorubrum sp. SL192]UYW27935.1 amylo-alpha-1,6-glucosidase [Methylorubrum extorquens]UYW32205.1 amylo-alpha-1,6-glucosidase [Methylorubrum extorquens]